MWLYHILSLTLCLSLALGLKYDAQEVNYNLNQNKTAENPLDYWGEWTDHTFNPSPTNWRFPFYTLFLDRFVNGDPTNDNANGTVFEQDVRSNQLRAGGDLAGLVDTLDYIQGMGIKGLYIAGTPFINFPWKSDAYSPLDLSLLDHHFGDIQAWRTAVQEIHNRGMYVVLDNTMSTMGDLIGFDGFTNTSTPFSPKEHKVLYKTDRQYLDFKIGNTYNDACEYPRFWNSSGERVLKGSDPNFDALEGCYDSDFDQYGDTEAFGFHPDWQRQLSKFASTQDRLREWLPSVRQRLERFNCITIAMLDIDGFRFDKALQVTVDAQAEFGDAIRQCAKKYGKTNFFLPGEITGGNTLGSIYLGRGREPEMVPDNITLALTLKATDNQYYLRDVGKNALDGAAFHYSVYRSLTRFLGMDGNLTAGFDVPINFVDTWNTLLTTNDMSNAYSGKFDPRHMYGTTNQDVFRWPAIKDGTQRMLLGLFITTLHMPGIPLLLWGEEQAFYVLDSTASNYLFGRQPMSSGLAWQDHGCYNLGSSQYYNFAAEAALTGCKDDSVSLDHRDPTHPVRNIIKSMYHLRTNYPVLNDGFLLQSLSNKTRQIILPGSNGTATEIGIWSVMRNQNKDVQNLGGQRAQSVWLVYHNDNQTVNYSFDCSSSTGDALIAPFDAGTTVKNLLAPYDEIKLGKSKKALGIDGSENFNGCSDSMQLDPYAFKAYVPIANWISPPPVMTKFVPGHDARIISKVATNETDLVDIELHFSQQMDCNQITLNLKIDSTTTEGTKAQIQQGSVVCESITQSDTTNFVGAVSSTWRWTAKVVAPNGIHTIAIGNAMTAQGNISTGSTDHLMFRTGQADNPIVFPRLAAYRQDALYKNSETKELKFLHRAAGADRWRYSLNWESSWSDWMDYTDGITTLQPQPWSGTSRQKWVGDHVIVQYWSRMAGSSNHIQHSDADWLNKPPRQIPHLFAHGPYNEFGIDAGIQNEFEQLLNGTMKLHVMTEWPSTVQLNVWGMNPDKRPDASFVYGDIDNDGIIDRMPPDTLMDVVVNLTALPPAPYLAYELHLDTSVNQIQLIPVGDSHKQVILFALLWAIPVLTAAISVRAYMGAFYGVKFNKIGVLKNKNLIPFFSRHKFEKLPETDEAEHPDSFRLSTVFRRSSHVPKDTVVTTVTSLETKRRTVLIATMEYDIEDWAIKVKIGGLGVMAQLMGKSLEHQNLIWVVPCVGGIDFPVDTPAPPMHVTILGKNYEIDIQYHQLKNITYVLLDAPIFRKQTKTEPYPPRMDDLESAVYYSAWNSCIAQTIKRFPIDIYHINDYHGAAAPLYLLPDTIPCCLSLHNAEFQGLWPMRNQAEREEVSKVYNLDIQTVEKYVQYGEVFNLLHAAASYLRIHQKGFGAVGVSRKYGARSYARYPVFWGLKEIGSLPNPDPTDLAPLDPEGENQVITVDPVFEAGRADLRRQAQEWANLTVNPQAELFVFVGRWSVQKGVDLIADVFPSVLEKNKNVQLICVGPVIDLYGKFAALKLGELMNKYPGRVYSKPEFTALPPYIFSGAEFALIPSRDEPFGLVAVEFGRKGALGVGARVGGLGQMPGWWFTVESVTNKHLAHQFKSAIFEALESTTEVRAMMRARSAKQRFPVAQWVKDLDILQSKSIKVHREEANSGGHSVSMERPVSGIRNPSGIIFTIDRPRSTVEADDAERPILRTPSISPPPPTTAEDRRYARSQSPDLRVDETTRFRARSPDPVRNTPDLLQRGRTLKARLGKSLRRANRGSSLSINEVTGTKHDFKLQMIDPTFNDTDGEYYKSFETMLKKANDLSEEDVCIGDYLDRSERAWFTRMRAARLGRSRDVSPARSRTRSESPYDHSIDASSQSDDSVADEFLLGENYQRPSLLKRWLATRLGDWPVYSLILGLGQIMSVNSYQMTLLTGNQGSSPEKLYIVGAIFMATSCLWWVMFRKLQAIYVLSIPWLVYGIAFLLVGVAPFLPKGGERDWIRNIAVGFYTTASSSGSIFFALNFGDEGGAPIKSWVYRACFIQGTQQIYLTALFYWGSKLLTASHESPTASSSLDSKIIMPSITFPIALLCLLIGILLFTSLPQYYRESPGKTPHFYKSLLRRKIIGWFFILIVLQNYFLSAPYGRNWSYLWSSKYAPDWAVGLLVLFFFIVVWACVLAILGRLSTSHSWIIPIFAIGLGAPRWCQMLWGTSGIGLWVPWMPGGPIAGALAGRSLWLWLGVLDAIQGVGFGMMLLVTLTRVHVAVTLMAGQLLGAAVTLIAKATAPDRDGPGDVFPDFSMGVLLALGKPWFWIALGCQLIIPVGLFMVFRKAQLSKP